jgi:hypothetical protein
MRLKQAALVLLLAPKNGWADRAELERLIGSVRAWAAHPDAYFANIHIEVIGWKPN